MRQYYVSTITNFQIKLNVELRAKAEAKARELGFDNLAQATRFLIVSLVRGDIQPVVVTEDNIPASAIARLDKMAAEAMEDYAKGNAEVFNSVNEYIESLR